MKVILIRHAESLANVDPKYYTYHDSLNGLSEKGVKQATDLHFKLKELLGLDYEKHQFKALASGLLRTQQTAKIVLFGLNIPVTHDDRLNERAEDGLGWIIETEGSVRSRFTEVIEENDGNLIIFSHCNAIRAVLSCEYVDNTEFKIIDREKLLTDHLKNVLHCTDIAPNIIQIN